MKHLSTLEFKDAPELSADELIKKEFADFRSALEKKSADDHAALKRRLDEIEAKASRLPTGNSNNGDDALAIETKALNKFLRGGVQALDDIERKTMNIGSQASGGYVVAPEYSTRVIEKLVQFSPLRGLASVMSIGTTEVYIPVVTDQADGGWVTETGPRPTGESAFDQVDIKTYEYAGVVPVSRQLLEDSIVDLSGLLLRHLIKKFGKSEATSFMVGDGNGKPTGLLHTPGDYNQITAKQDGSDLLTKLIDTFYALPDAYASVGSWLMKRQTMGVIRKLADASTGNRTLWSDSLANGTPPTLLGRPVYEAIDMDPLVGAGSPAATTYPIAFGDYSSAYQIVDRVGMAILEDQFTGADNGIVKFRARRRVGGKPVLSEAVVLVKATA